MNEENGIQSAYVGDVELSCRCGEKLAVPVWAEVGDLNGDGGNTIQCTPDLSGVYLHEWTNHSS